MPAADPRELVGTVERRLEEVEAWPEGPERETATALIGAILDLYGAGLERIVEEVAARDDGTLAEAFADDDLIGHLLVLHGLHPDPVEDRVARALDEVRPYLESHGGNVELIAVQGTAVTLSLQGSCSGCPSSAATLKHAIEEAIHKAAPEIEDVIARDAPRPAQAPLIQLEISPALTCPLPTVA